MQYYDSIANGYDELHREEQEKKIRIILNEMSISPTDLLLDVGCGTGFAKDFFKCNYVGIDPSENLLSQAKGGFFIRAAAEALPFEDNSFDIVISITAIQNFSDMEKGLDEIKRVTKGRIVISALKKSNKIEKIEKVIKQRFKLIKVIEEDHDLIFFLEK